MSEDEQMQIARAAYEIGRKEALRGVRTADPRVILSKAKILIDDESQ